MAEEYTLSEQITNVHKCTESWSSSKSVICGLYTTDFRRSPPSSKLGMVATTSSFEIGRWSSFRIVEQTDSVLHFLRHYFCLLLNSAQRVEVYTRGNMKGSCLLLVVLQSGSPSGREHPSVAEITEGVWWSCGMPRPHLQHCTSGVETEWQKCGC